MERSPEQKAKRSQRKQLKRCLANLSPAELAETSAAACGHLITQPAFARAGCVMMFLSLAREVDTQTALAAALDQGKRVVVPTVDWPTRSMTALALNGLDVPMSIGRGGVREPMQRLVVDLDQIDLVIVPGLGFDLAGGRLGRGGGFYDRFLNHPDLRAANLALGLECQLVPELVTEPHDQRVAALVTERGVRIF